ncbi:MAG: MmgE/PrpD family protein [Chloroflexi bacterium]|nr:MmgE/PrpD family protein [Chloroflexota bacterium]
MGQTIIEKIFSRNNLAGRPVRAGEFLDARIDGAMLHVEGLIRRYIEEQGGKPEATLLRSGVRTSVANAALGNGTLGHALDFDDMGGFGHPTVCIFPALLALAEKTGATGKDLLEAYVVGCEVGVALQRAVKVHLANHGFHRTAIFGRLASAVACSKLLKLAKCHSPHSFSAPSLPSPAGERGTQACPCSDSVESRDPDESGPDLPKGGEGFWNNL